MQQDILPTTKQVIEKAQFVSIDDEAVHKFCGSFSLPATQSFKLSRLSTEEGIGLISVFNCINFCFWSAQGEEKWSAAIAGEMINGSSGAFRALEAALHDKTLLLNANFLQNIDKQKLGEILRGTIEIPLLNERVRSLREAGTVLLREFRGSFINMVHAAHMNAVTLTNLFIRHLPSFNDCAPLGSVTVEFHKRAQLNARMIGDFLTQQGEQTLENLEALTAFADYKVPQVLRALGILRYSEKLSSRVDSYEILEAGSREEIEIRAGSIWAVERMKHVLQKRFPDLTAGMLDGYLWELGQQKSKLFQPYHRTKTIYY